MAGPDHRLSVIALVSGGKDSFYSILHCLANDHRVVALGNLYPAEEPHHGPSSTSDTVESNYTGENDTDLNSFMYQTVGHQIIPLYAQATALPLYRQAIVGTAVDQGLNYQNPRLASATNLGLGPQADHPSTLTAPVTDSVHRHELSLRHADEPLQEQEPEADETESLVPLLQTILEAHPEANALCTGAILSTYQRTRVESVALRLGLTPLSFLWQYTELPRSLGQGATTKHDGINRDDAQLLRDMAAVGLEARIVKVASAGLDEDFLWENVSSEAGVHRVEHAMRRFGSAGGRGSILGEGGEFETLVVDGPSILFKGHVVISEDDKRIVREGGGCAWLRFVKAKVEMKTDSGQTANDQLADLKLRIPEVFDARFEKVMQSLVTGISVSNHPQKLGFGYSLPFDAESHTPIDFSSQRKGTPRLALSEYSLPQSSTQEWRFLGGSGDLLSGIEEQAAGIVHEIRRRLDAQALQTTAITNSLIVLRHMSDFPRVNEHYGSLFPYPNPPSRVTISCGEELLPQHAAIAVYLTVQPHLQSNEIRGLHVQSRSYWAPANIGPYSQAIAFPLISPPSTVARYSESDEIYKDDDRDEDEQQLFETGPLAVCIAGQIPLIPALMTLPPPSESNDEYQITLALQHLWRIALEMQVRWWTSAVAYFPATPSPGSMQHRVLLAATAWKTAHIWPLDDTITSDVGHAESDLSEDEEDVWDRRYNLQSMAYHGGEEEKSFPLPLPDWSVLKGYTEENISSSSVEAKIDCIPFMFAAEVEELPRQASVEWQAHLGLAELRSGSVTTHRSRNEYITIVDEGLEIHHTIIDSSCGIFIQTIASLLYPINYDHGGGIWMYPGVLSRIGAAVGHSYEKLGLPPTNQTKPKITYTDSLWLQASNDELAALGTHIPCHSLWDSQGRRLNAVCVFETRFDILKREPTKQT
ncbi:adenine nucleotide alpha hydrolases-like protein [Xylariaceae sp. FL1019]|nr:adenine nucleotide alpha hydrolases-like protein [Xylariaceae sp. FL1019]